MHELFGTEDMTKSDSEVRQKIQELIYNLTWSSLATSCSAYEHLYVADRFPHPSLDEELGFQRVFSL